MCTRTAEVSRTGSAATSPRFEPSAGAEPLPDRWRALPKSYKKSDWTPLGVPPKPTAGKGYFSSYSHAKVVRKGREEDKEVVDEYVDKTSYAAKPRPKHGLSFGSNGANKRDQFTLYFEQER
jgi:hypothetical protein